MTAPPIDLASLTGPLPPIAQVAGERYPTQQADEPQKVAFVRHLIQQTNPIALSLDAKTAGRFAQRTDPQVHLCHARTQHEPSCGCKRVRA